MSALPDPLSFLSQALQSNAAPQDASQAPPMAPPTPNQGDQTSQPPQRPGGLRSLLSNFFQGAGAAMTHEVGLPTPYDKQQQAIQTGLQQQQAASLEGLRQAQEAASRANSQLVPYQLPDGSSVMIPAGHAQTLAAALAKGQFAVQTNAATNATKVQTTGMNNDTKQNIADNKPDKPGSIEQQMADAIRTGNTKELGILRRAVAMNQSPQRPNQQLGVGPDGKVIELRPGMTLAPGTKTIGGDLKGSEPTAAEKNRADFANNLNENLDQLEEIAKRRPDLFGPIAGRLTQLKMAAGSSDPDIGKLKTINEQVGIVQQSTHGMKSAVGVERAANSVLNSYLNEPAAVLGSIGIARNSAKTFTNDANRGSTNSAPASGPPAGATHIGTSSVDGRKYYLDSNNRKLGPAQ